MGAWYHVVKTIKGHRYIYRQRTQRRGRQVHTESHYVGVATGANPKVRIAYHGSPNEHAGPPEPSREGTFGPGLYLSDFDKASNYARYDARWAAKIDDSAGPPPPPQFDGTVHAFQLDDLKFLTLTWIEYLDLVEEVADDEGDATPENKAKTQAWLAARGVDGIVIDDKSRPETVVFPSAIDRLHRVNTTD